MASSIARPPGISLRISRWLIRVVAVLTGIAVAAHVGILFLYNAPDNYAKLRFDSVINWYVGRALFQRWYFFAPDPISSNEYVLVRARTAKGTATPWLNVSQLLINDIQKNRFSPYEFMLTGVSNGVLEMPSRYHFEKLSQEKVDLSLLNGFRQLLRTGASALSVQYRDTRFTDIQIAFLYESIPKFTEREQRTSTKPLTLNVFRWQKFPQGVDTGAW